MGQFSSSLPSEQSLVPSQSCVLDIHLPRRQRTPWQLPSGLGSPSASGRDKSETVMQCSKKITVGQEFQNHLNMFWMLVFNQVLLPPSACSNKSEAQWVVFSDCHQCKMRSGTFPRVGVDKQMCSCLSLSAHCGYWLAICLSQRCSCFSSFGMVFLYEGGQ